MYIKNKHTRKKYSPRKEKPRPSPPHGQKLMVMCGGPALMGPSGALDIDSTQMLGGLFEKGSHHGACSSREPSSAVSSARPTGSESEPLSPLPDFMARLFPSGLFLECLAGDKGRDGSQRPSYYKPASQPDPTEPNMCGSTKGTAAEQRRLSPHHRRDPVAIAAEREQRIKERVLEQERLEKSMKRPEERRAAEEAAARENARQERIRQRAAAGSSAKTGASTPVRARHPDEQEAQKRKEQMRLDQIAAMKEQEVDRQERSKAAAAARAAVAEAKKREQQVAAERKAATLKEKQQERMRANEEKRERARRVQMEHLQQQRDKKAALEAKKNATQDTATDWWCDVAMDGCARPCKGHYEPSVRYGVPGHDDYIVCESCFLAHLSDDQQAELELIS